MSGAGVPASHIRGEKRIVRAEDCVHVFKRASRNTAGSRVFRLEDCSVLRTSLEVGGKRFFLCEHYLVASNLQHLVQALRPAPRTLNALRYADLP